MPGMGARVAEGSGLLSRPGVSARASSNLAPSVETAALGLAPTLRAPTSGHRESALAWARRRGAAA